MKLHSNIWSPITSSAFAVFIAWAILAIMKESQEPRTYEWSSQHSGWHARANTHPSPKSLDFDRAKTLMVSTYNALSGDGFNMALFQFEEQGHIAIDHEGNALVMRPDDAAAFINLLQETSVLSISTYRILHRVTCRPFDILKIANRNSNFETISIYGFSTTLRDLEDGAGQLPVVLWELFGLIEEAKRSVKKGEDTFDILQKVRSHIEAYVQ